MLEFLTGYGVWIAGIAFLIDDLGIPFPSGTLLFSVSVWARAGGHIFLPLFIAEAIIFSMISNALLYSWGRRGVRGWLQRHGHRFFLSRKRLQKIECFFEEKHGPRTILLASLVNNTRPIFALLAGASRMRPEKFFPMNAIGIVLWATGVAGSGYLIGPHAHRIWQSDGKLVVAAIVAYLAGHLCWQLLKKILHLHKECPTKQ